MMAGVRITEAMVLAAGFGKRMRPLTDHTPKPLIGLFGKPLIAHGLEKLAGAGVERAVVNVHYLADQVEARLAGWPAPQVVISDERDAILETGGGLRRAAPLFNSSFIFVLNSDTTWHETSSNLARLAKNFDPARMDMLLLLADNEKSLGDVGRGDFFLDGEDRLVRRKDARQAPYTYAGAMVMRLDLIAAKEETAFSLNVLFDEAIGRGRLYGQVLDGTWMHVGTPEALSCVEAAAPALEA